MDSSELLPAAAAAARAQARWRIRAALREVSLQALQQSLDVNHEQQRIILTESSWKAVQRFCQAVADRWSDKLRLVGHHSLADLVQNVAEKDGPLLFDIGAREHPRHSFSESKMPASDSTTPSQAVDNIMKSTPGHVSAVTCHGKLRQLGRHDVLAVEPSPALSEEAALNYLNSLGRENQTDWPFSWRLMEEATERIPARLHGQSTPKEEVTLIPKSLWLKQIQESGGGTSTLHEQQSQEVHLLDRNRKRKNADRDQLAPSRRQRNTPRIVSARDDIPRPPSLDDGSATFSMRAIREEMTDQERAKLDAYLHSAEEHEKPRSIVLGGLRDVGHFHYWNQQRIDPVDKNNMTDKKRRRLQRKAVKERLGDHKDERDTSSMSQKRVSRVLRTVDDSGRQWFDFDLGECWLEKVDPGSGSRMLYAFSSLEVLALDEESADDPIVTERQAGDEL